MSREMLIIHESLIARKIAHNHVKAEFSDIGVTMVSSAEEGLKLLAEQRYDLVLCAMELAGVNGLEFHKRMRVVGLNKETPFIIVTSTNTPEQRQRLAREGIDHVLFSPYTGADLAKVVDRASDPRDQRVDKRYGIPGAELVIWCEEKYVRGTVLNISMSGVLYEMTCPDSVPCLLDGTKMDILMPKEFDGAIIRDVHTSLLRLNVIRLRGDLRPDVIRVARKFESMPEESKALLMQVLAQADRELHYG